MVRLKALKGSKLCHGRAFRSKGWVTAATAATAAMC